MTTTTSNRTVTAREISLGEHCFGGFRYESRVVPARAPTLAPVVLVGGAFQRKEDWGRFERGLLAHADVVTVDLPGWGGADLLPDDYGADFLADALDHLLDELNLTHLNVVAGSYGTGIAYRVAQRHPHRFARMALIGTMTEIPVHAAEAFRATLRMLADGDMTEFETATVDLCLSGDPDADVVRHAAIRRILVNRVRTATPAEIEKYVANTRRLLNQRFIDAASPPRQPVLVATGEYDTFTTPDLCRELAATCADSWLAVVKRADHLLHLERAPELVDLLARYFSGASIMDLPYCHTVERISAPG